MVDIQNVGLFLCFWTGLYLADILLRSNPRTQSWYCRLMDGNGLVVSICQVRWYTQRFNRLFIKLGQCSPWCIKAWFSVGAVFGLVAQIVSVYLLTYTLYQTVAPKQAAQGQPEEEKVLTPVMPGVNLPTNQLGYYLMTLFVCGILHEAGHAVAAVSEQVKVNGFGVFFLALYPGAFVDMHSDHLHSISPFRQLRIYCAGIWHNFVIVLAALAVLLALPYLTVPVYRTGAGATVTHVVQNSPVDGPRGLKPGDKISRVDACYVVNSQTWMGCVQKAYSRSQIGYCVSKDQIRLHDISQTHRGLLARLKTMKSDLVETAVMGSSLTLAQLLMNLSPTIIVIFVAQIGQSELAGIETAMAEGYIECCNNLTNTHICFKTLGRALAKKFACLPARHVTASRGLCYLSTQCPLTQACTIPSLQNQTRLVRVQAGSKEPLLFLGHSVDLIYSVQTSDYSPKFSLIPLNLPYIIQTFCRYLVSLSGALVILNVVPCYALDGQWILRAFIEISTARIASKQTRINIFTVLLLVGTLILALNLLVAMWTLFR